MLKYILILLLATTNIHAASRCENLLIKTANQYYHIKYRKFFLIRYLDLMIKMGNYDVSMEWVPLNALEFYHRLDYPIERVKERLKERIKKLQDNIFAVYTFGLTATLQRDYFNTDEPIKVVYDDTRDVYITLDGNGRLLAMLNVLAPDALVQVKVIHITDEDLMVKIRKVIER